MLGVLGGMGPASTAYFYSQFIASTPATSDQEHIPIIIWGDGRVPDRTDALLGSGESPVPAMIRAARGLQRAGADLIAVPCNTAHAFLPEVAAATGATFIDMIRATARTVSTDHPGASRMGILATRGTRATGLYRVAAEEYGLVTVDVDEDQQSLLVDEAIRIVKRGGNPKLAERLVERATIELQEQGADVVIAGCTELPLVMERAADVMPVLDSVSCLAEACVREFRHYPAANQAVQLQTARWASSW